MDLTALAREPVRSGRIGKVTALPQADDGLAAGGFSMFRRGFVEQYLDDGPGLELASPSRSAGSPGRAVLS